MEGEPATETSDAAEAEVTARPRLVTPVFVLITVATFAYFLSIGILIPTLPLFVQGPLGGGPVAVGLAVGSFSVSALFLRPWAGRLGDARGRRLLVVIGASLVTVSVAGYVVATWLPVLVALRLVAGAGEAFFYVGAAAAINDLAPEERRGEAMSLFSLALYGALAAGPVIGEVVLGVDHFTAVWAVASASALAATVLGAWMPDTRPPAPEVAPRSRLIHRAALGPGVVVMTSVWGFAGFDAFMALYARELGLDGARIIFAIFAVIVFSIRGLGARIPDHLGFVRSARLALATSAAGLAVVGIWHAPAGLYVGTAVFAVGQALAFPALMSLSIQSAPAAETGSVVGTFTAFVDIAFGVGALSLGAVAVWLGLRGIFLAASAVAVAGLFLTLFFGEAPGRRAVPAPPVLADPAEG